MFIIGLLAFYIVILSFCIIVHLKQERTMGIDSKGELIWMDKKELKRLRKKKLEKFH